MASLTRSRGVPEDIVNDTVVEFSPQGDEWGHGSSLYTDEHAEAWSRVTSAIHEEGGLIFAQLWHVGRVAHPDMPQQKLAGPVAAPSPIAARGGRFRALGDAPYVKPERAHPDPMALVKEYTDAAVLAKKAGFDGVALHCANGCEPRC